MRLTLVGIGLALLTEPASVLFAVTPNSFDSVTLERSPCFGAYSAYTVEIKGNGEVRFNGKSNVAAKGERHGKASASDIEFLNSAIKRVDFSNLRDSSAEESDGCNDMLAKPSLSIKVSAGGATKAVEYQFGCQAGLATPNISWLADTIDEVGNTYQWVGVQ